MNSVKNIVIVGGGTAGWFSAALLSRVLGSELNITLVESDKIGIVGVGEATIPPIQNFNAGLGIDEAEFLQATKGSIKLGIQFENWGKVGDAYMHAFGGIGKDFPFASFHHFWLKSKELGVESDFWDFSLNYQAAKNNKFGKLNKIPGTNMPGLTYAYHFDAGLYANFLRDKCLQQNVQRVEGEIVEVKVNETNGYIESLVLDSGQTINGELFIDCSGMHELLIEKTLHTGYDDWSHWLPCNRAMAVPCELVEPIEPYTRSVAHHCGWRWRIPLQHRTGNGLVYSSRYMSDDEAKELLLNSLDGKPLAEPKVIPFRVGRRRKQWNKNVIAIGLSSGFLEPLESTSIHLIQTAVTRLLKHFPHQGIEQVQVDEFNRQSKYEMERIRDFIILHYKLNDRDDSQFWRHCKDMDIPESLRSKIELFKKTGNVYRDYEDLFTEIAWQQVMIGQGLIPDDHHPVASTLNKQKAEDMVGSLKTLINTSVSNLPKHGEFLASMKKAN